MFILKQLNNCHLYISNYILKLVLKVKSFYCLTNITYFPLREAFQLFYLFEARGAGWEIDLYICLKPIRTILSSVFHLCSESGVLTRVGSGSLGSGSQHVKPQ